MSAVSLTINALTAQAAVTAITGTRIKVLPLPDGTALPAIAVALSAEEEESLLAGASQYPAATVQVHCIAEKGPDAIDLGETVKTALRDLLFINGGLYASFTKEAVDFTDYSDDISTHRRVMSFSVRWRSGIEPEVPGVVADQSIEIGGKTLAGAGGAMALDEDSAEVEFVSVDSVVSGTGTGWSVSGGRLIRSSTPAASDGAVLTCTTALGAIDVTIVASGTDANGNNLANSYSVIDWTQLEAAAEANNLAHSDNILLRTGDAVYNAAQTGAIGRTAGSGTIDGSWTAPSLYDAAHPDKGYDLDTGTFVKITPHAGASPVIARVRFLGNQGGGAAQYFRLSGLTFVYPPLVAVTGATYTSNAIAIDNGAHTVAIDNCDISSQPDEAEAEQLQIYSGIGATSGTAWIQDNYIHDVGSGIQVTTSAGGTGGDVYIIGNTIEKWWADGMLILPSHANYTIAWNVWTNCRALDEGGIGGGLHPDCLQFHNNSMSATNVRVICNRFQIGDFPEPFVNPLLGPGAQGPFGGANPATIDAGSISGTTLTITDRGNAIALTDGMTLYGTGVTAGTTIVFPILTGTAAGICTVAVSISQTVASTAMMATHTIRDSVIAGNLAVLAGFANLINLNSFGDSVVYNNTAVEDSAGLVIGAIYMTNPDGIEAKYNISNANGPDTVQSGVIARTATVYDDNFDVLVAGYSACFDDPQSGSAITDIATQYAVKAGSGADTQTPIKAGAHQDYIDWVNREHAFPWE